MRWSDCEAPVSGFIYGILFIYLFFDLQIAISFIDYFLLTIIDYVLPLSVSYDTNTLSRFPNYKQLNLQIAHEIKVTN